MESSRRAFLGLGFAALGATLVAACSSPAAPAATAAPTSASASAPAPTQAAAPAAQSSGTLAAATLVWWQNDGEQSNRIKPVTDAFTKANPQVQVQILVISGDMAVKLATSGAANTLPDLDYPRTFTTADYAIRGWLYSIDDYVKRDAKDVNVDDLDPLMTVKEKWQGKWYSLPENFSDIVVYYNKKLFDANKVDYPKDTWTWSDFRDTSMKFIQKDSSGKQTLYGADISLLAPNWINWGVLLGNGGQVVSADLKKSMVNSKQNADTLQFLADLIHVDHASPAPNELPQGVNPFGTGLVAMVLGGSWAVASMRDTVNGKFDWDVAAIPVGSTGKYGVNVEGGCYGIGSNKQADTAWQVLKYATSTSSINTEVNTILFSLPGRISSRADWLKVATTDNKPPTHAPVFFDILKNTTPEVPVLPYYTEFEPGVRQSRHRIMSRRDESRRHLTSARSGTERDYRKSHFLVEVRVTDREPLDGRPRSVTRANGPG